jgi:lipid-A-disaccharide synthase
MNPRPLNALTEAKGSAGIMFVAGDPSGDAHAAPIIRALKISDPSLELFGIGGPLMEAAGFKTLLPFAPFNKMGIAEVLAHFPFFLRAKKFLIRTLRERRPRALVCIDYPGFNIPMLKAAHALEIPVVWYIVPQVWAWKKKRAAVLGNHASFIGTIFPFELHSFTPYRAPVAFVGHPLVEELHRRKLQRPRVIFDDLATRHEQKRLRCAILPGSRAQEIRQMLAPMAEAFRILRRSYPGMTGVVSRFASLSEDLFRGIHAAYGLELSSDPLDDLLDRCDVAIVTSGTATLQTALRCIPLVVAYKTSPLTYAALKRMITVPFIGLPNIVAGKKIVPECIQDKVTGQCLADALKPCIDSLDVYRQITGELALLESKLGAKRPSEEIARVIANCGMER